MKKTPVEADRIEQWTRIVEAARQHPSGVGAYCNEHGINQNTYYYWFGRLKVDHPEWSNLAGDAIYRKKTKIQREKKKPRRTEVEPKAKRRKFTSKYKQQILQEVDAAEPGTVGAILRREGLYYSILQNWRGERTERDLKPKKRGPLPNPAGEKTDKLLRRIAQLEKKLRHRDLMLELQKKITEILETESVDEES
jgi:transposase-like protein